MKLRILPVSAAMLLLITACTTTSNHEKVRKIYTADEAKRMTMCVGIADSARYIATEKTKGVPLTTVKAHYAGKTYEKINLALADKVYEEQFTSIWDYSVGVFDECAANLAKVSKARVRQADSCMQALLVADVAYGYKVQGASKDKAYAHFAKYNGDAANKIIDTVYASSKSRGRIKLDLWKKCIQIFSE